MPRLHHGHSNQSYSPPLPHYLARSKTSNMLSADRRVKFRRLHVQPPTITSGCCRLTPQCAVLTFSVVCLFLIVVENLSSGANPSIASYLSRREATRTSAHKDGSTSPILCWIMVTESILRTSTAHVNATWCRRCDDVVFLGDTDNKELSVVGLGTPTANRTHLTEKRTKALEYLYQHKLHDADWFFKADSDSYVIMENLRHFLSRLDPNKPLLIGHMWTNRGGTVYPAGGGGYVMSREAVRRFGSRHAEGCETPKLDAAEEVHLARCLAKLGVELVNALDGDGKTMAHQYPLSAHLKNDLPKVYSRRVVSDENTQKNQSISKDAFSFHYMTPDDMYLMEYLLYQLNVHRQTSTD